MRRKLAYEMGGPERIQDQRDRGKLPVRERIDMLIDPGSLQEVGVLAGHAEYEGGTLKSFKPKNHVFGHATIGGKPVILSADDFTSRPPSGSAGVGHREVGHDAAVTSSPHRMALDLKLPLVRLIDAVGHDVRGIRAAGRSFIPDRYWANSHLAPSLYNEVPIVAAALGPLAGHAAAEIAATHFSVMVRGISQVFAAGPPVVRRSLSQEVTKEELGGYMVQSRTAGLIDNEAETEAEAFEQIRTFLSYMPRSVHHMPPVVPTDDPADRREEELLSIIPRNRNRPYNVRKLLSLVFDKDSLFEMGQYYGRAAVTMLGRLQGHPVGVIGHDPLVNGGGIDAAAAQKVERFIDLCDTFNLPIVDIFDVPGFMVGRTAEAEGTLKHGIRMLFAIEETRVPWASVLVRRVYGVAGVAHRPHNRYTFRVGWPSGEWGGLPIEGGVDAAYRREIEAAEDPERYRAELEAEFAQLRSPFRVAETMGIEDLIDPRDTRPLLCRWVESAYELLPLTLGRKDRGARP